MLALQPEPLYAAEAKRRQATSTGGARPQLLQNSAKAEPLHTDDQLAKLAGTSRDTIRKVKVSIYADQRIGELLRELPKGSRWKSDSPTGESETKAEALQDAGISRSEAYRLEELASNPDVVQAVLDKAEAERVDYMRRLLRIEQPRQKKE